jgi:glutaredoxin
LNQFTINCDEYILDDKQKFLNYIETIAEKPVKLFPMVFLNGKYIGGYIETLLHCEEEEAFSDKIIF